MIFSAQKYKVCQYCTKDCFKIWLRNEIIFGISIYWYTNLIYISN